MEAALPLWLATPLALEAAHYTFCATNTRVRGRACAWTRGREYINEYLYLVNLPINSKVGDKFARIEVDI